MQPACSSLGLLMPAPSLFRCADPCCRAKYCADPCCRAKSNELSNKVLRAVIALPLEGKSGACVLTSAISASIPKQYTKFSPERLPKAQCT